MGLEGKRPLLCAKLRNFTSVLVKKFSGCKQYSTYVAFKGLFFTRITLTLLILRLEDGGYIFRQNVGSLSMDTNIISQKTEFFNIQDFGISRHTKPLHTSQNISIKRCSNTDHAATRTLNQFRLILQSACSN
jgi:hypothetical protein